MNERIQEMILEFAEIAEEYSYVEYAKKQTGYSRQYFYNQKFAELIVQECISILEQAENGYRDYRNQIEDGMRNHCIGLIKHKFGVE